MSRGPARLGRNGQAEVDDDTLLFEIARRALGGPTDDGRASCQVAVTQCPDCGLVSIDAAGQGHAVNAAVAEMVGCDCQEVGRVDAGAREPRASAMGEELNPHVGARVPDRAEPTGASPHVGATPAEPRQRATQSIPPATRRQVLRRDGNRCVVPGCQNHRFLDVHHVVPRAEGGTHDSEQLATLCGLCRARHDERDKLLVSRPPPDMPERRLNRAT